MASSREVTLRDENESNEICDEQMPLSIDQVERLSTGNGSSVDSSDQEISFDRLNIPKNTLNDTGLSPTAQLPNNHVLLFEGNGDSLLQSEQASTPITTQVSNQDSSTVKMNHAATNNNGIGNGTHQTFPNETNDIASKIDAMLLILQSQKHEFNQRFDRQEASQKGLNERLKNIEQSHSALLSVINSQQQKFAEQLTQSIEACDTAITTPTKSEIKAEQISTQPNTIKATVSETISVSIENVRSFKSVSEHFICDTGTFQNDVNNAILPENVLSVQTETLTCNFQSELNTQISIHKADKIPDVRQNVSAEDSFEPKQSEKLASDVSIEPHVQNTISSVKKYPVNDNGKILTEHVVPLQLEIFTREILAETDFKNIVVDVQSFSEIENNVSLPDHVMYQQPINFTHVTKQISRTQILTQIRQLQQIILQTKANSPITKTKNRRKTFVLSYSELKDTHYVNEFSQRNCTLGAVIKRNARYTQDLIDKYLTLGAGNDINTEFIHSQSEHTFAEIDLISQFSKLSLRTTYVTNRCFNQGTYSKATAARYSTTDADVIRLLRTADVSFNSVTRKAGKRQKFYQATGSHLQTVTFSPGTEKL